MNALFLIQAATESVSHPDVINELKRYVPGLREMRRGAEGLPVGVVPYECELPIAFVYSPADIGQHPLNAVHGDLLFLIADDNAGGRSETICRIPQRDFQACVPAIRTMVRALLTLHGARHRSEDSVDAIKETMHTCYAAMRKWLDEAGRDGHAALWNTLKMVSAM